MNYRIKSKETLFYRNRYIVDLNLDEGEVLNKEALLQEIDGKQGAPFGGAVDLLPNGLLQVDVYTD
jgi:hypothetical protein